MGALQRQNYLARRVGMVQFVRGGRLEGDQLLRGQEPSSLEKGDRNEKAASGASDLQPAPEQKSAEKKPAEDPESDGKKRRKKRRESRRSDEYRSAEDQSRPPGGEIVSSGPVNSVTLPRGSGGMANPARPETEGRTENKVLDVDSLRSAGSPLTAADRSSVLRAEVNPPVAAVGNRNAVASTLASRHVVRSRVIAQKQRALLDPKALDQVSNLT